MISLRCPSCNGELELPENLERAHCLYCGTKILLQESDIPSDRNKIEKYRELSKTALETQNYQEAVDYCNKVLELNPKDIESWIDKGIATYKLSSPNENKHNVALGYLNKASQISPNDIRISKAKDQLFFDQAQWYVNLGNQQFNRGKVEHVKWSKWETSGDELSSLTRIERENRRKARKASNEYFIKAMTYYIQAAKIIPDNLTILSNIEICAHDTNWINWPDVVERNIESKRAIVGKQEAENKLPALLYKLEQEEKKLDQYKSEKGFANRLKARNSENRIKNLQSEIKKFRRILAM